eukprot:gene2065-1937_t
MNRTFKTSVYVGITALLGYGAYKTLDNDFKINEFREEGGFKDYLRYLDRRKANGLPDLTIDEIPEYWRERYQKHISKK